MELEKIKQKLIKTLDLHKISSRDIDEKTIEIGLYIEGYPMMVEVRPYVSFIFYRQYREVSGEIVKGKQVYFRGLNPFIENLLQKRNDGVLLNQKNT